MAKPNHTASRVRARSASHRVTRWIEPKVGTPGAGLPYWRERVLNTLLFAFMALGLLTFAPSTWLALRAGLPQVVFLDLFFLACAVALFVTRSLSLPVRATIAVSLFYLAGMYLLLRVGPMSGGPIWLFAFPVMTGVLLGLRPALVALGINTATMLAMIPVLSSKLIVVESLEAFPAFAWTLVGLNLLLLNAAVTLSLAVLLQGIDSVLAQERIVSTALARERQQLLEANEQLETAMLERQRAEQERTRLIQAVDQAAEVILLTDHEGIITYANPALETTTGYQPQEVAERNVAMFFDTPETADKLAELWSALHHGEVWGGRIRGRRRDGRTYEVELTCSPVTGVEEETLGYLAVMRDTTREQKLEARLRQTQKLEAIGTLAGGIAHDFNNILVPILGFAEMLERTLPEGSLESQRAERIVRASERGRDLVRQILTFSRKVDVARQLVYVDQLALEALHLLRPSVPHNVEVVHELQAKSEPILADPTQLHQIIMNLCTNACHAMEPDGGVLTLRLDAIDCTPKLLAQHPGLRLEPGQRYLRLIVQDTGIGMDSATSERIFDPFFTTKSEGRGTGLGLATVHGIVTELEGAVTVDSEPRKGTVFTVYFPCAPVVDDGETVVHRFAEHAQHRRVLLVDDEEMILQYEEEVLRSMGFRVLPFSGPHAALEYLRQTPNGVDIIVTDFTMPGMSGLELAAEADQVKPGIPIVIATGFSDRLRREQLEKLGIDEILLKPFSREELADAIRNAGDRRRRLHDRVPQ